MGLMAGFWMFCFRFGEPLASGCLGVNYVLNTAWVVLYGLLMLTLGSWLCALFLAGRWMLGDTVGVGIGLAAYLAIAMPLTAVGILFWRRANARRAHEQ
jgi:hypothetical protein